MRRDLDEGEEYRQEVVKHLAVAHKRHVVLQQHHGAWRRLCRSVESRNFCQTQKALMFHSFVACENLLGRRKSGSGGKDPLGRSEEIPPTVFRGKERLNGLRRYPSLECQPKIVDEITDTTQQPVSQVIEGVE